MEATSEGIRSVSIDPHACIRCWACCSTAPSVFLCPGREGYLPLLMPRSAWRRRELEEAVDCCPSAAILVDYADAEAMSETC